MVRWKMNECGKRAYFNRKDARKAASEARDNGHGKRSAYRCHECDLFHITSLSAKQKRGLRNRQRRGVKTKKKQ